MINIKDVSVTSHNKCNFSDDNVKLNWKSYYQIEEDLNAFWCIGFTKSKILTSMYKLTQEYLSVDPAGIILKNCCESLITEQGSFTLFVCIKIDPSGKEVFVPLIVP